MMKTLIAEDDPDQREALSLLLHSEGYDVVEAASGIEAWHEFENSRFTLVLSDWLMPQLDGLELSRRIRATERPYYPYVILLTALKGKDHFLQAMSAGIDDFISKPFDADELRAKLHVAQRIVLCRIACSVSKGSCPPACTARKSETRTRSGCVSSSTSPNAAMRHSVMASALIASRRHLLNWGRPVLSA